MELSADLGEFSLSKPSTVRPTPLPSVWATRRARALRLATELPEAEELLCTYAELLPVQARVADAVPVPRWLALVSEDAGPPRLRLDRLPVDELVPLFASFLSGAAGLGGGVLQGDTSALSGAPGASWLALIGTALAPDRSDDEPPFHVRAFLQPVATALATTAGNGMIVAKGGRCLVCGGAPAIAVLQDLPGGGEARGLVCSMCGTTWRAPGPACVHCEEVDPKKLPMNRPESVPWVGVDSCASCGRYLKTVDLRACPEAVPLVDDLATRDLDLWAFEHGLTRIHESLFGPPIG